MDNYFLIGIKYLWMKWPAGLESIDVIDLELFNEQMTRLIQGR